MKNAQVTELLLQALETELGGVQVYKTALKCAQNEDLHEELTKYLAQTTHHVEVVRGLFADLGLDPEASSPGRDVGRWSPLWRWLWRAGLLKQLNWSRQNA